MRVRRVLSDPADAVRTGPLCYASRGFSLHAATQIQAEVCFHCGGKMRVVAAVTDPSSVRHYLEGTGQSAEIPTLAPARSPPQEELDFDF